MLKRWWDKFMCPNGIRRTFNPKKWEHGTLGAGLWRASGRLLGAAIAAIPGWTSRPVVPVRGTDYRGRCPGLVRAGQEHPGRDAAHGRIRQQDRQRGPPREHGREAWPCCPMGHNQRRRGEGGDVTPISEHGVTGCPNEGPVSHLGCGETMRGIGLARGGHPSTEGLSAR